MKRVNTGKKEGVRGRRSEAKHREPPRLLEKVITKTEGAGAPSRPWGRPGHGNGPLNAPPPISVPVR